MFGARAKQALALAQLRPAEGREAPSDRQGLPGHEAVMGGAVEGFVEGPVEVVVAVEILGVVRPAGWTGTIEALLRLSERLAPRRDAAPVREPVVAESDGVALSLPDFRSRPDLAGGGPVPGNLLDGLAAFLRGEAVAIQRAVLSDAVALLSRSGEPRHADAEGPGGVNAGPPPLPPPLR